ncbi:hypothetical protein [Mesobacterium pallidum]|uniref:hypothetical protein n=1 Tax=Mesobacterium pallidum TaxID=2872037 RepID=UPI001EE38321|nr:hypothetical protein [Mesobacterium pallidum]
MPDIPSGLIALGLGVIALWIAAMALKALRTGEVRVRGWLPTGWGSGRPCQRLGEPLLYWYQLTILGLAFAFCVAGVLAALTGYLP